MLSEKKKSPRVIYHMTLLIEHALNDKIIKTEKPFVIAEREGGVGEEWV